MGERAEGAITVQAQVDPGVRAWLDGFTDKARGFTRSHVIRAILDRARERGWRVNPQAVLEEPAVYGSAETESKTPAVVPAPRVRKAG